MILPGSPVINVDDCTDADGDTLVYTAPSPFVFLNANSDELSLQTQLDYENIKYHTFAVTVSDGTNTATVSVFVTVGILVCTVFGKCKVLTWQTKSSFVVLS